MAEDRSWEVDRRRDAILVAAAELLDLTGYDETTMEDLAKAVGCSRQAMYDRKITKTAVLVAIADSFHRLFVEVLLGRLGRASEPDASPLPAASSALGQRLVECRDALHELCVDRGPFVRVALAARRLPWVRRVVGGSDARMKRVLAHHLGLATLSGACLDAVLAVLEQVVMGDGPGSVDAPALDAKLALEALEPLLRRSARLATPAAVRRSTPPFMVVPAAPDGLVPTPVDRMTPVPVSPSRRATSNGSAPPIRRRKSSRPPA
jgi:AcrR family transcriptional regulator